MAPRTIQRFTLLFLALGFGAALVIFLTAEPDALDPLLGDPLANKKFIHELRVWGGKGNVIAARFIDWWGSLWRGRALAGTVAVITVLGTLAFRFVAARPDLWRTNPEGNPPPSTRAGP